MSTRESLAFADSSLDDIDEITTVDDIRDEFTEKFSANASRWSERQRQFSKKLNTLGNQIMSKMAPEKINKTTNIDTLVKLSNEEIQSLREEMDTL